MTDRANPFAVEAARQLLAALGHVTPTQVEEWTAAQTSFTTVGTSLARLAPHQIDELLTAIATDVRDTLNRLNNPEGN